MQGTFWNNSIWYFILAAITAVLIIIVLVKTNNRKFVIGFGLAILGLTFYAETGLLTLLDAYSYFPKLNHDPFLDSVIGNYFSQILLTATALLVSILQPPRIWYFLIAAAVCLIEGIFLWLGIFEQYWYQTWYTFILVLLLLGISNNWYRHMAHSPNKRIYYLTQFLGANAALSTTLVFFLYAFSIQKFNIVVYPNEFFRNQALLIVSYRTITILLMMIIYHLIHRWRWKGVGFILLFLFNYILFEMGFQTFKFGSFWIVTLANIAGAYLWLAVIDYLLKKGQLEHRA